LYGGYLVGTMWEKQAGFFKLSPSSKSCWRTLPTKGFPTLLKARSYGKVLIQFLWFPFCRVQELEMEQQMVLECVLRVRFFSAWVFWWLFSFLWVLLESFACVVAPSFLVSRSPQHCYLSIRHADWMWLVISRLVDIVQLAKALYEYGTSNYKAACQLLGPDSSCSKFKVRQTIDWSNLFMPILSLSYSQIRVRTWYSCLSAMNLWIWSISGDGCIWWAARCDWGVMVHCPPPCRSTIIWCVI
jgi:hypothetical protein